MAILHFLISILLWDFAMSQMSGGCPSDWVSNNIHCYKFVYYPERSYEQSRRECAIIGASLVSVTDPMEHDFINQWLQVNDIRRGTWFTSGYRDATNISRFDWISENKPVVNDETYWIIGGKLLNGETIVYKPTHNGAYYGWAVSSQTTHHSYICEIEQEESYKVVGERRTFDYGQVNIHEEDVRKGPQIIIQPENQIVVADTDFVTLECAAIGNPQPEYKWFKAANRSHEIRPDKTHTLTNGRLTIQNPTEKVDANTYQCTMENEFGEIFSDPVSLSFGFLGEFSNVPDAPVFANAFEGAVIKCSNIQYKPAAVFNWQRGQLKENREFIFSTTTPYIFLSNNGNLYFSEVTRPDDDDYFCQITLASSSNAQLGTSQAPSSTSLPITMIVRDAAAKADWGPQIQDDFIAVFPQPPLWGQDIRMECFAYGTSASYLDNWVFWWTRDDGNKIPDSAEFEDFSRVMVIRNIQIDDEGTYSCHVRRGVKQMDRRQIYLKLEAKPYFVLPLQNQHVDKGSQLTWRCEANGYPKPTYAWYKNGKQLLSTDDGTMIISGNIMTLTNLDGAAHNGMYQCSATNLHGTSLSAAQLRVLSFAPTFVKNPMHGAMIGALNGNITIQCRPEAAPRPTVTWLKNGGNMNVRTSSDLSQERIRQLVNGDLYVTQLTYGDAGMYTCQAENAIGKSQTSGRLTIKDATVITRRPKDLDVFTVNSTAFIPCEASYDPQLDLIYVWKINGHTIDLDFKINHNYNPVVTQYLKGLYVRNIQLDQAGIYECWAKTPLSDVMASGRVVVNGPPGEPAGVFADTESVTAYSIKLHWFSGASNGDAIQFYVVQSEIEHESGRWRTEAYNIPDRMTLSQVAGGTQDIDMRSFTVSKLRPGNSYSFRVQAVNQFGFGKFSLPSMRYTTDPAPPVIAPMNIRGGNGSVGDLTMKWDKLPKIEHGGPGLGYHLYWRMYDPNPINNNVQFSHANITNPNQEMHVTLVGLNNYYLLYEIKMQAFNNYGRGPNSTITLVYSAEGMPVAAPQNVFADATNSTAMEVWWDPIPDTREVMKGKILGYQMNYWDMGAEEPIYKRFIRFRGNVNSGVGIGLWYDSWFVFEVQVYNSAGLGPISEQFAQETQHDVPKLYPTEVYVWSHSSTTVKVTWRGITTAREEDVIDGFYIYLWLANEHYRTAKMIETEKFDNVGFILDDLKKGLVYAIRIAGRSLGGEGKKSPTVYFTLGGQVQVDPTLSEIRASAPRVFHSHALVTLSSIVLSLFILM